ncbi:MAG: prepilin-type cleavage/methylation domain-containing protein [Flavobacteriales bacterium]|nr:prepilin-type cleavage/methylation domain-containing protein [Flavobacteriales bacterium]
MNLKYLKLKTKNNNEGFTLVELIISVGMLSMLSGLILPSFLNWIRTEKVNSYTRELKEYFRVIKLDSRRWGSSCLVNINSIAHNGVLNDKNYYGYKVTCSDRPTAINNLAPALNNSIFQIVNKEFLITPNGRISSDKSIVIVIGSKYHIEGAKILNCLVIQSPTGHILKGKFAQNDWITKNMQVSKKDNDNILTPDKCKFS